MDTAISANLLSRLVERLLEVRKDVVNVLDAYAQPNHFRRHACFQLFFRRQLTMCRGSRVASQRFRVAHLDHALEQTQRVKALYARLESTLPSNRRQEPPPPPPLPRRPTH